MNVDYSGTNPFTGRRATVADPYDDERAVDLEVASAPARSPYQTVTSAAKMAGRSRRTINRWIQRGVITLVGDCWIQTAELDEAIAMMASSKAGRGSTEAIGRHLDRDHLDREVRAAIDEVRARFTARDVHHDELVRSIRRALHPTQNGARPPLGGQS